MQHAKLFLNKVIEENDVAALARHNVNEGDMHTNTDRNTLRFIEDYAQQNGGKAPSYAVVADSVEGFEDVSEVSDSFEYLVRNIKDFSADKAAVERFATGGLESSFKELG